MSTTTADTLNHSFATPLRANSFEASHSGSGAAGTGGIGGGDDNEFKPKRNPLAFVIGAVLVAGAGFGIFKAIEADGAKITPEQATHTRNDLQSRPKAEQLPEWRKWAARDDVPLLQQEAFAQLAWAKDPEGLALIVKGLESVDHRIRSRAAQAILEYGRDSAATTKAPLLKALAEADDSDKPQIAWALATIGAEEAFDATLGEYRAGHLGKLQRLNESPAFDTDVLSSMVSLDRLAALAGDASESVRQLVATVLSRTGDGKWDKVLINLVGDTSIDVAREAAVGLGKIATDAATKPLVDRLATADKESRAKFLEALRDGIGTPGLVLALSTVRKDTADREKFQTKQLFDMMKELEDPRAGTALAAFAAAPGTHHHWRVEAALRMAAVGDLAALPHLAWRLTKEPKELYDAKQEPEYLRDDNERVYSARMIADLAVLNPDKAEMIREATEKSVLHWATDLPQPHANAMRALAAMGSKEGFTKIKGWADPSGELPKPGFQGQMPDNFSTAQSALRYAGWSKDEGTFSLFTKQLGRKSEKLDITMEALQQGGIAILGMTLRALEVGAAQGMSEFGAKNAASPLTKFIEDATENEQARLEAGSALGWVMDDADADKIVDKIVALKKPDPRAVVVRTALLEALLRHGAPGSAKKLLELLDPSIDLAVRHNVARVLGSNGLDPSIVPLLLEKAKTPELRGDAVLALLLGGTEDDAQRAMAVLNDGRAEEVEELKQAFDGSFSYWTSRNYDHGDVARWARNAQAATRVRVFGMYPEWPHSVLSHALAGLEFDNGPHSMTRVQLRVRLLRDAKSADATKRLNALTLLEFTKERGALLALRTEPAPLGDLARAAYFRVMNPRLSVEAAAPVTH